MAETPAGEGREQPGSFDSLPSFTTYYLDSDGRPVDPGLLHGSFVCEECEQLKPDVVGYSLPMMILLPQAFDWIEMSKCRRCMRLHILTRLWWAVLLSHVFCPIILGGWGLAFAQTFYKKPA
jgi:hypothetical protein